MDLELHVTIVYSLGTAWYNPIASTAYLWVQSCQSLPASKCLFSPVLCHLVSSRYLSNDFRECLCGTCKRWDETNFFCTPFSTIIDLLHLLISSSHLNLSVSSCTSQVCTLLNVLPGVSGILVSLLWWLHWGCRKGSLFYCVMHLNQVCLYLMAFIICHPLSFYWILYSYTPIKWIFSCIIIIHCLTFLATHLFWCASMWIILKMLASKSVSWEKFIPSPHTPNAS